MGLLGFDQEEKESFIKGIATILLLGNIKLKENERNQALFVDPSQVEALCVQLGCDAEAFGSALLNPVMKAGTELVVQGRDLAQVEQSLEALSRALYERLFTRLVDRINQVLSGPNTESLIMSCRLLTVLLQGVQPTGSESSTLPVSKFSSRTALSSSVLTTPTKNSSSFLTTICSMSSRQSTRRSGLTGRW